MSGARTRNGPSRVVPFDRQHRCQIIPCSPGHQTIRLRSGSRIDSVRPGGVPLLVCWQGECHDAAPPEREKAAGTGEVLAAREPSSNFPIATTRWPFVVTRMARGSHWNTRSTTLRIRYRPGTRPFPPAVPRVRDCQMPGRRSRQQRQRQRQCRVQAGKRRSSACSRWPAATQERWRPNFDPIVKQH